MKRLKDGIRVFRILGSNLLILRDVQEHQRILGMTLSVSGMLFVSPA